MKKMLLILSIFVFIGFFYIVSKETPNKVTQDTETEYDQPAEETITAPEQAISPLMDQFLRTSAGSHMNVTAGGQISGIFELWEALFHHPKNPNPMDIYFEVEAEGKIQKDHVWKNKTYRTVLDEYCQDNDLVWKITGPNTIRIDKKTM